jgi:putative DNA primase/helicase
MDNPNQARVAPLTEAELAARPVVDPFKDDGECVMPVPADAPAPPDTTQNLASHLPDGLTAMLLAPCFSKCGALIPLAARNCARCLFGATPQARSGGNGRPFPRQVDRLAAKPDASVVICEGEKAADAAARIFPESVFITSPGGSQAASKADWSPVAARRVLIWPDADEPGEKYAGEVAVILHRCEISIVDAVALASMAPDGGSRTG